MILFLTVGGIIFAQQEIKITVCDEMKYGKSNGLILFSVIENGDTLSFPKVGKDTFLNPFQLHDTKPYDRTDSTIVELLIENNKYLFFGHVYKRDLYCPFIIFCIEEKKSPRGYVRYSYTNCAAISEMNFIKRKKK